MDERRRRLLWNQRGTLPEWVPTWLVFTPLDSSPVYRDAQVGGFTLLLYATPWAVTAAGALAVALALWSTS